MELFHPPEAHSGHFTLSSGKVIPTSPVFDLYWRFAAERQDIFVRRVRGDPAPWTLDPILRTYRFTNPYRASDRVSQYLIRNVIYKGSQDVDEVFFRILLFKLFNRIETWEVIAANVGSIAWHTFDFRRYDEILSAEMAADRTIYSPAYIIPSPGFGHVRKHSNHLSLLQHMMKTGMPAAVTEAKSLKEVFLLLRGLPSLGDFLAFQYTIDLNYSGLIDFSEMDFVVAGPGALSGLKKCFPSSEGIDKQQLIREVALSADREFERRGLSFARIGQRPLQLIDCQNLFCEIDKYSRVSTPSIEGHGRVRIKRKFESVSPRPTPQWYPPKWGIDNESWAAKPE